MIILILIYGGITKKISKSAAKQPYIFAALKTALYIFAALKQPYIFAALKQPYIYLQP